VKVNHGVARSHSAWFKEIERQRERELERKWKRAQQFYETFDP